MASRTVNKLASRRSITVLTSDDKFMRQDILLNLLQRFLTYKLPHSEQITNLPDNFFSIDQIILEPEFAPYKFSQAELINAVHEDPNLRFSVRENRVRVKPPELNKDRVVQVSKKLSWILRHGAERVNMQYMLGGFLYLDEVLGLPVFEGISLAEVENVVENNNKKRFEMSVEVGTGRKLIRAVQGHSVEIDDPSLRLITDPDEFPTVIHGTYHRAWESIRESGLSRMQRTHIHFAPGIPGDDAVISGMRKSADVLIQIDMRAAMRDGLEFYLSVNSVILTRGDSNGFLLPKYFKSVQERNTGKILL